MTTPSQRALILYRPRRFINHLLTYLLTYSFEYHAYVNLDCVSQLLYVVVIFTANELVMSETTEQYLPAEETDDSCRLEFIEIVPLTRDTDGPCTTECESRDWSAEVKQENLPAVVKQEPDDV